VTGILFALELCVIDDCVQSKLEVVTKKSLVLLLLIIIFQSSRPSLTL